MAKSQAKNYFIDYIAQRIKQNKNFLAAVCGGTGSGKSWSAIKLGEILDPEFDIRNVCFTAKEFMSLVNSESKQLHSGSVIVWDELQISLSHLEYQSLQARLINYTLQTFRHKNFILIVTTPHFSFINASARKLFHARIETQLINHRARFCNLKPLLMQVNQNTGDIYSKYLRVYTRERGLTPLKVLRLYAPSESIVQAYEQKKAAFTSQLNANILQDLDKLDHTSTRRGLTDIQAEIVQDLINGMLHKDIARKRNIADSTLAVYIRAIRSKGITIKAVRENKRVVRYDVKGYEKYMPAVSAPIKEALTLEKQDKSMNLIEKKEV